MKTSKKNVNFKEFCHSILTIKKLRMDDLEPLILSRNRFLKFTLKCFALTAVSINGINCGVNLVTPKLSGITPEDYHNFRSLQEIFLVDSPITNFDLGLALDKYVYGHPYPIETESMVQLLASIPSSILAAIALDFSFTPLVKLSPEKRMERLLGWKKSSLGLKRGLFTIFRQISFFLLSSDKEYQKFVGYIK